MRMRHSSRDKRARRPPASHSNRLWWILIASLETNHVCLCQAATTNNVPPTTTPSPSSALLFASDAPSLVPSMVPTSITTSAPSLAINMPSDVPSLVPSEAPSSLAPSTSQSDYPSLVPSATAGDVPATPIPTVDTVTVSDWPSMVPSAIYNNGNDVAVLKSVTLQTIQRKIMDGSTVDIFESVCQKDFLQWYMPRISPTATYSNIVCTVVSQNALESANGNSNRLRNRQRWLQQNLQTDSVLLQLFTASTSIRLRITMEANNLPIGVTLKDILRRTFEQYASDFQRLLALETSYFEPVDGDNNDDALITGGTIDGIVRDTTNNSSANDIPKIVVIASALVGAGLAMSLAILYARKRTQRQTKLESLSRNNDSTDDSILLLFDNELGGTSQKRHRDDMSFLNSYLPPTPLGVGVPSEIGPDSWIEPDDELSHGSPENQGIEAFIFARPSVGKEIANKEKILPQSRATEIFKSITVGVETMGRSTSSLTMPMPSYHQQAPPAANLNLSSLESTESCVDDQSSRPTTVSSRGSQPTKSSSSHSRRTNGSISDGSSTLHGLKLVGTMSGFQGGVGMVVETHDDNDLLLARESSTVLSKKTSSTSSSFFRKMMQRKPTNRVVPPTQKESPVLGSLLQSFSSTTTSASPPAASSPLPKSNNQSLPRPRSSNTPKSKSVHDVASGSGGIGGDASKVRPQLTLSIETATEAKVSENSSSIITDRVTAIAQVFNEMEEAHVSSGAVKTKGRGASGMKKPTLTLDRSSLQPSLGTEKLILKSPVSPDISVDVQRAAGTPMGESTSSLGRFEECTPRSPLGSFVRKNETPSGTRFLQMNLASAEHTGNVLEDLGRLEDEWDGQLESTLSASATTPRRTNSEKFRKAPRRHIYEEN